MKGEHEYATSVDPVVSSLERSHFSMRRADKERVPELERIRNMDLELLPVLARMEHAGVYVDREKLSALSEELQEKSRRLEIEMRELVGEPFNPLSAKQVQYVLYEKLHIPVGKKIKTGFSVDSETLEEIGKTNEIANMILEYRGYEKLRSTYAEGLQKEVASDGRIHTTYNQTLTSTGRLSSENPNLQNIPAGSGYAASIKSSFRPGNPGECFLVADYSQVELRILAMLSGDRNLLDAFRNDEDIHERTARFLFPNALKISGEERRVAKSVNFGVIYGITGFGLSKMIRSSPTEATEYINRFYAQYPKVKDFYDGLLEKARISGYVETYFGRRRYVKGLNDANRMMRAGAEREAMNAPIQGTAADVIKLAMIEIDRRIADGLPGKLLMQVHDELVFEVKNDQKEALEAEVREVMEGVLSLNGITLKADIRSGSDWASAKG